MAVAFVICSIVKQCWSIEYVKLLTLYFILSWADCTSIPCINIENIKIVEDVDFNWKIVGLVTYWLVFVKSNTGTFVRYYFIFLKIAYLHICSFSPLCEHNYASTGNIELGPGPTARMQRGCKPEKYVSISFINRIYFHFDFIRENSFELHKTFRRIELYAVYDVNPRHIWVKNILCPLSYVKHPLYFLSILATQNRSGSWKRKEGGKFKYLERLYIADSTEIERMCYMNLV